MPRTTPLDPISAAEAPWLGTYAGATADAVASGLGLLDDDEVEQHLDEPDPTGEGRAHIVHVVHADPPRTVRAVAWTRTRPWSYTDDPGWDGARAAWWPLDVARDCDPLALAEAVAEVERARPSPRRAAS